MEHINIEQYVFEYIWIAGYQIHWGKKSKKSLKTNVNEIKILKVVEYNEDKVVLRGKVIVMYKMVHLKINKLIILIKEMQPSDFWKRCKNICWSWEEIFSECDDE